MSIVVVWLMRIAAQHAVLVITIQERRETFSRGSIHQIEMWAGTRDILVNNLEMYVYLEILVLQVAYGVKSGCDDTTKFFLFLSNIWWYPSKRRICLYTSEK